MDVRWVSSLSWYFLNFLGLNGLYRIILGGDNCKHHSLRILSYPSFGLSLRHTLLRPAADASKDMAATPFNTAMPNAGQPQDYNKLFKAEKDNLEFAEGLYKWAGEDVETRVLRKYGRP